MRTLWNKSKVIEKYLLGVSERHETKLINTLLEQMPGFRRDMQLQKEAYSLIKHYHRKRMRSELDEIFNQLMIDPGKPLFRNNILRLFKRG